MSNIEKLNMMYKQLESTKSRKSKTDLQKGIYRLEKKLKMEKAGMRIKDGIYYQIPK